MRSIQDMHKLPLFVCAVVINASLLSFKTLPGLAGRTVIRETTAGCEPHLHQPVVCVVPVDFKKLDDIGVLEPPHQQNLAEEVMLVLVAA
jgi:hypothetical protein